MNKNYKRQFRLKRYYGTVKLNRGICLDFFMYFIRHCFICRPSDTAVSEAVVIEPKTVAALALAVRRSNHRLDLIQIAPKLKT